jgi:hypothetical protein
VGDLVYQTYLHVRLPALVACSTSSGDDCLAGSGQFPSITDNPCNPCVEQDIRALKNGGYLKAEYDSASATRKEELVKEAKNAWRRDKYGAGSELSCCTEGDADCPDAFDELAGTWVHWTNDVGHFMIQKAKILIGGQQVDQLWGTFLFCWEELTGKSGRRLTEMTGRRYTRQMLICDSREERDLYVPLPFWYTQKSGNALPLAALAYHGVQLNIDFEALDKLIVVSKKDVAVRNARTGVALTASDLNAKLEVTYVYLEQAEREKFSSTYFEQLIVQTQHYFKSDNKSICRINLSFNHPTMELIFGVRRLCQEKANNWSNLSGVDGRDPIVNADLLLNTTSRFGNKPAAYWRCVVPYQVHTNVPEYAINVMSFALNPESSSDPSGSCNLSRIDNIELVLEMQSALEGESYTVFVFSRSWNVLRFREGVAGAAFQ